MTIPTEKINAFLAELTELTKKHGICIRGPFSDAPFLEEIKSNNGKYEFDDSSFEIEIFWMSEK